MPRVPFAARATMVTLDCSRAGAELSGRRYGAGGAVDFDTGRPRQRTHGQQRNEGDTSKGGDRLSRCIMCVIASEKLCATRCILLGLVCLLNLPYPCRWHPVESGRPARV